MYVGLKQIGGGGEYCVTPARAAAKETRILSLDTSFGSDGSENAPQKVNSRFNKLLLFQPFLMIHCQMLTTFSGAEF